MTGDFFIPTYYQGVSNGVYQNSIYRQRLTAGGFDVSTVTALMLLKTRVVSSQHLPAPG